jgi:hypothetical protein
MAFTALLGVVAIGLPLLIPILRLSHMQDGVVAGLTTKLYGLMP